MSSIEKYFEGEKLQCIVGIIISILFIALSVYFLFLQKPLLKGIAYSSLPFSILLLIICIGITVRTPKDVERITTFYKTERQKMQTDELPRMERIMKNFTMIKRIEILIFIAGLLLAASFWKNSFVKGIAMGLMTQSVMLYLFDYIASMRGKIYFDFLKSI